MHCDASGATSTICFTVTSLAHACSPSVRHPQLIITMIRHRSRSSGLVAASPPAIMPAPRHTTTTEPTGGRSAGTTTTCPACTSGWSAARTAAPSATPSSPSRACSAEAQHTHTKCELCAAAVASGCGQGHGSPYLWVEAWPGCGLVRSCSLLGCPEQARGRMLKWEWAWHCRRAG